eukprot:CAMPEP_0172406316 /NCGR_PEP_ID=MMETSP1061-20121228/70260_1 /TAXON_ID=37318 /ORGANISM="Pseudo-nitzschia pungens, Strain cf. pungens" /LENGTH=56 /DNA_ID=CAMNT_0013141871 /DNA_START=12 /DNA_END=179 /DNA_ORIENTATION=+
MSGSARAFRRASSGSPVHEMSLSKEMFSRNGFRRFSSSAMASVAAASVLLPGSMFA